MPTRPVDVTLTSTGGCTVKVKGTVSYTVTLKDGFQFGGFKGTISTSGPEGCANGTMTFKSESPGTNEPPRGK